jgi:transcriptional regulator with XRE-family HTH domain
MEKDGFKAWRKRMRLRQQGAAEALGVSRSSVQLYEMGRQPIPRPVELACAALARGVTKYDGPHDEADR